MSGGSTSSSPSHSTCGASHHPGGSRSWLCQLGSTGHFSAGTTPCMHSDHQPHLDAAGQVQGAMSKDVLGTHACVPGWAGGPVVSSLSTGPAGTHGTPWDASQRRIRVAQQSVWQSNACDRLFRGAPELVAKLAGKPLWVLVAHLVELQGHLPQPQAHGQTRFVWPWRLLSWPPKSSAVCSAHREATLP